MRPDATPDDFDPPDVLEFAPLVAWSPAHDLDIAFSTESHSLARFDSPLGVGVKEARLLNQTPWVRTLGRIDFAISTEGWKFPAPPTDLVRPPAPRLENAKPAGREVIDLPTLPDGEAVRKPLTRIRPTADTVLIKDRLLYLLQPPLDDLFNGRALEVPFELFPYQREGIAFMVPRHSALLADEMGLGKTAQSILALRLLFHQGVVRSALLVAPKQLIHNWGRELKLWAPDLPFEVFPNDPEARRTTWLTSNCPLKLINYEAVARDAEVIADPRTYFDVVLLDEAQRIKNKDSRTAEVVCSIRRGRSWALTGTPIENRVEDLINIFAFVDPGRVPADTPTKRLAALTCDSILRRTKDQVQTEMPAKMIKDLELELTPAQRTAYDRAENDGIVHLNELGQTITVQHVFQLVMRLKQICNFDPLTGESAKLEQLITDMDEVAANGRKAIIFSQWVEPLEVIAKALGKHNPLMYHGRVPQKDRTPILDRFKADPDAHVILMTYGTGSVGLNLQFTNYVFLFDRWWNPAVEDQAINRAHRIGQQNPVTVTRFLCESTIEQRIAGVLEAKRKVFNDLIASAEKPAAMLTEDEIFGLFDLKARPKRG